MSVVADRILVYCYRTQVEYAFLTAVMILWENHDVQIFQLIFSKLNVTLLKLPDVTSILNSRLPSIFIKCVVSNIWGFNPLFWGFFLNNFLLNFWYDKWTLLLVYSYNTTLYPTLSKLSLIYLNYMKIVFYTSNANIFFNDYKKTQYITHLLICYVNII